MVLINYISVSLTLLCIVISLIILLSLYLESERHSKLNLLFRSFVLLDIGFMTTDIVAWAMVGNTASYAFWIIRIANFLHFAIGPFVSLGVSLYLIAYIERKNINVFYGIKVMIFAICGVAVFLTVVSQFNNMYYTIDQYNVYHRGELFWLAQLLPATGLVANMWIMLLYRKVFKNMSSLFFTMYMTMPGIAMFIQYHFFGISFVNIVLTLLILILYIRIQTEQTNEMASHIRAINRQLELQQNQYARMIEHYNRDKAMRHNIRHHFVTLKRLANAENSEKIKVYLTDLTSGEAYTELDVIYCENLAVNAVVSHYLDIAKAEGIEIDARLVISEEIGCLSAMDLCVILGNLLENAVEACRQINESKFIRASSMLKGNTLFITVDNSFYGEIKKDGDTFMSTKREGEGIGTSSVKAIVEKYGGEARFETKGNEFRASVMLRVGKTF
ncbi:MAG: GHKL domain-containing protein [Defluviitaleaceae bacterium]|nr:GHKL domain-containing protein [Defluviitaleaceae bacterium]